MKTFKDFKKDKNRYVPEHPIHFKNSHVSAVTENYIQEKTERYPHISEWLLQNDNPHLSNHEVISKSSEEISSKLAANSPKFTDDHHKYINQYTQDSSGINKPLIKKYGTSTSVPHHVAHFSNKMDEITQNPIGNHLSVYSGIGFDPAKKLKSKDSTVFLPAYTSATHDKQVANFFTRNIGDTPDRHILHIRLKPNDWATHISQHSNHPTEHETIIARNTELKIHPEPKIYTNDSGEKVHIWNAHISNQY
jgi:hypothetical protein